MCASRRLSVRTIASLVAVIVVAIGCQTHSGALVEPNATAERRQPVLKDPGSVILAVQRYAPPQGKVWQGPEGQPNSAEGFTQNAEVSKGGNSLSVDCFQSLETCFVVGPGGSYVDVNEHGPGGGSGPNPPVPYRWISYP